MKFISAPFTSTDTSDDRFGDVKIVYCNPPSSLSSVDQPVDFIMQEGGIHHINVYLYVLQVTMEEAYVTQVNMYQGKREGILSSLSFPMNSSFLSKYQTRIKLIMTKPGISLTTNWYSILPNIYMFKFI